jgi:muconolactone delta-isomerase
MRFLVHAAVRPGADAMPLLPAETARVQELIADGTAEQAYVRADHTGAYLVINTPDVAAAEEVMQSLPMAKAGFLDFSYVELVPSTS